MNINPVDIGRRFGLEAASAALLAATFLHIGSLTGITVVVSIFAVVAWGVMVSAMRSMMDGTWNEAAPSSEKDAPVKPHLMWMATAFAVFAEVAWFVIACVPIPPTGELVASPLSWCMANVTGLSIALAVYRHSKHRTRVYYTLASFGIVLGSLFVAAGFTGGMMDNHPLLKVFTS